MRFSVYTAIIVGVFPIAAAGAQRPVAPRDSARPADLPAVQVTATPKGTTVLATPQPTAVLDGAALRRAQGSSLGETLEQLPGVRSLAMTPGIGKPVIRGLTNNRVVTLANGQRTETQQWGHDHSPNVEAADAAQLDVVKGPASVLYGSDALGGVVNVVRRPLPTADDMLAPVRGRLNVAWNSAMASPSATLALEGSRGAIGWRASGTGRRGGDVRTPVGPMANSGMAMGYGEGSLGWRGASADATLHASRRDERLQIAEDPVAEPGYSGYQRIRTDRATLDANVRRADQRLQLQLGWERNRRAEFESADAPLVALGLGSTTANGFAHWHHAPVGGASGIIGVFAQQTQFRKFGEETLIPNSTTGNAALYAFEQLERGRWSWALGARQDWRTLSTPGDAALALGADTRRFAALTGTIGTVFRMTDALALSANVARGFRAPSASDLWANGFHEGTRAFERGDATLRTETSVNTDLGLRWRGPRVRAELTGFVNGIRDYIYLAPFGAAGNALDSLAVRQGDARLTGLEAQVGVALAGGLRLDASADAVRGQNLVTGGALPFIPPFRSQGTLRWDGRSTRTVLQPSLQIGGEWQAQQTRTFLNDFAPPAYGLVHLGASAGVPTARGVVWIDVSVRNAANARFRDFLNRYKEFAYGAGRAVVLRVSTDF